MNEEIKVLYLEILRFVIKNCGEIVAHSWRYHVTYLKVLEVIIDSNYNYSEDFVSAKASEAITPGEIQKQKTYLATIQSERKEVFKTLSAALMNKTIANPVRKYIC